MTIRTAILWTALMGVPAVTAAQHATWPASAAVVEQANRGDAEAQAWLGVMLITGEGQRKDANAGIERIKRSAAAGSPLGQRLLGDILSSGKLVAKDEAAAVEWYLRAAKAGDPDAQSELGVRYTRGWGLPVNDAEAVRWEEKAAAGGDVAAMMYLASRYESGKGVEKNLRTATELFRQAAGFGSAQGMCFVGDMYLWGSGVANSVAEAYRWYFAAVLANPPLRPIRPVNFITLQGEVKRRCERAAKDVGKKLDAATRASQEQLAREWLATVKFTRLP